MADRNIDDFFKLIDNMEERIRLLERNQTSPKYLQKLTSDPSNPKEGRTYFNTSTKKQRTYDGNVWRNVF